ncbi:carboxypeptidase regulatory-like domain-containing protein, partial [Gemmatimonas sp.]|uniref:carboxypeptidase regulatory-like domain-containing protein n=1 Tax=Gemmatimonas sp. TaxID=1962908 RepID=UPI0037C13DAC
MAGALVWGGRAPALHAQDTRPGASATRAPSRLSLALINVPLVEALETLSRQAQLNLVWQAVTLGPRATMRISCRLEDVLPEEALVCVTRAAGLDFVRLSSGTYVVIAGAEQPAAWGAFAGRVLDAASGEPLPQARVQLAEVPAAVLSADDGGFTFARLRPGTYELQVRAVGYRPYRATFDLPPNGSRLVRLPLVRTETVARPIIVNGLRAGAFSATLGSTLVADSVARRTLMGPSLFLPGAPVPLGLSRRDGTADLHLQGGDIGEHPWRLDGIPLYDLTALSGLLGLVTPVAIDELAVRRSGYRASEGSFATGVIDLKHAVGGESAGGAEVHVDPIAASGRWSLPVTVGRARGTVMVAGRTGLWQWTAPPALTRALRHWSVPDPVLLSRFSDFGAQPGMAGLDGAAFSSSVGDERVRLHDVHTAGRLQFGVAHTLSASAFLNEHGVSYAGAADDGAGRVLRTADRYHRRTVGGQLSHEWLLGTRVRQSLQLRASQYDLGHGGSMAMNAAPLAGTTASESNALTELAA